MLLLEETSILVLMKWSSDHQNRLQAKIIKKKLTSVNWTALPILSAYKIKDAIMAPTEWFKAANIK